MGGYIVVVLEEGGLRYHNAVAKATEIDSIINFLCKDITWIDLVRDMGDMTYS